MTAEPQAAPARYEALDSLRGVCALAVALYHYPVWSGIVSSSLVKHSFLFVDFFFVLSGFVIAKAYDGRLSSWGERGAFLIKRFGRIWPLHVAMLAVFVAVAIYKGDIGDQPRRAIAAIFTNMGLVHSLGVHKELTWNTPSWSISVEAFLYVFYLPFVILAWPVRRAAYVIVIAVSIAVLTRLAPHGMGSTYDYGVFRGTAGFFTGALVAALRPRPMGSWAELGGIVAVLTFISVGLGNTLAPLVFGAAVMVFANGNGVVSRIARTPPLLKLGEWSYSIYMVHTAVVAVVWAVYRVLGLRKDPATGWLVAPDAITANLMALPYLAAVVAVSAVTYTLIEAPARSAFARLAARVPRRRLAVPAA